jgi:transcriptional regulator with XRE-family HTH domain
VPYRKPDPALPKLGARLSLTRRALDLTRFQMAQLLGTDMATWGTYEAGVVRIPADQALKLSAYGIPLDWFTRGGWPTCTRTSGPKFASSQAEGAGGPAK